MASRTDLLDQLSAVTTELQKVQTEYFALKVKYDALANPPVQTVTITALQGVFRDDTCKVGDVANVRVVRGRVGQLTGDGVWNDIDPDTLVEYWVTSAGVISTPAVEAFYASA